MVWWGELPRECPWSRARRRASWRAPAQRQWDRRQPVKERQSTWSALWTANKGCSACLGRTGAVSRAPMRSLVRDCSVGSAKLRLFGGFLMYSSAAF